MKKEDEGVRPVPQVLWTLSAFKDVSILLTDRIVYVCMLAEVLYVIYSFSSSAECLGATVQVRQ